MNDANYFKGGAQDIMRSLERRSNSDEDRETSVSRGRGNLKAGKMKKIKKVKRLGTIKH